MKKIFIIILKQIGKLFIGILLGVGIELFSGAGLSYLVQQFSKTYVDGQPFVIQYPLIAMFFLGIYLVFWKKQYTITAGMFLGSFLFIFLLGIILTGA